jgi:hypothetical protein
MSLEKVGPKPVRIEERGSDAVLAAAIFPTGVNPAKLPRYSTDTVRRHTLRQEIDVPARADSSQTGVAVVSKDTVKTLLALKETGSLPAATFVAAGSSAPIGVTLEAQTTDWDLSSSELHFQLEQAAPVGATGRLHIAAHTREVAVVPMASVLMSRGNQAKPGAYVLVLNPNTTLSRRNIEIGQTVNGLTTVVEGLALRERVVSINAFFIDAELRTQERAP